MWYNGYRCIPYLFYKMCWTDKVSNKCFAMMQGKVELYVDFVLKCASVNCENTQEKELVCASLLFFSLLWKTGAIIYLQIFWRCFLAWLDLSLLKYMEGPFWVEGGDFCGFRPLYIVYLRLIHSGNSLLSHWYHLGSTFSFLDDLARFWNISE